MPYALIIVAAFCAFTSSANAAGSNGNSGSNGKWCLNERYAGPEANCAFQSMAQCNESKTSNSDSCTPNPRSTAGSGMHDKK